MNVKMNVTSS